MFRCGSCNRYLKLIIAKPQRLFCPNCDETFNIPQNGNYKSYKEMRCPIDNFELLYFSIQGGKNFIFCPNCYNKPPFENMEKALGCNSCTHQTCKFSKTQNGIAPCNNCRFDGMLVLDPGSGPPKWTVACNKCNFSVTAFKEASNVTVEDELCTKCQMKSISVKFREGKSKLSDGSSQFRGCLWCSNEFNTIAELMKRVTLNDNYNDQQYTNHQSSNSAPFRGRGRGHPRGRQSRGGQARGGFSDTRGRGDQPRRARGHSRGGRGGRGRGSKDDFTAAAPKNSMKLSDYL